MCCCCNSWSCSKFKELNFLLTSVIILPLVSHVKHTLKVVIKRNWMRPMNFLRHEDSDLRSVTLLCIFEKLLKRTSVNSSSLEILCKKHPIQNSKFFRSRLYLVHKKHMWLSIVFLYEEKCWLHKEYLTSTHFVFFRFSTNVVSGFYGVAFVFPLLGFK